MGLSVSQLQTMIAQQEDLNNQASMQETTWGNITMKLKGAVKGAMSFKETLLASGNFIFAMGHNMNFLKKGATGVMGIFKKMAPLTEKIKSKGDGGDTDIGGTKLFKSLGKIKMTEVLKGAAAMVLVAGSLWILGKALQEIQKVDNVWPTLAVAGVALLGFTAIMALVGALMMRSSWSRDISWGIYLRSISWGIMGTWKSITRNFKTNGISCIRNRITK